MLWFLVRATKIYNICCNNNMIITIEIDDKSKNNLHYNKYNIIKYNNKCINNK